LAMEWGYYERKTQTKGIGTRISHHRVGCLLAVLAEKLQSGKEVEAGVLNDLTEFLRISVEACHLDKEEGYLFPLLAEGYRARLNGERGREDGHANEERLFAKQRF
jgi:hemerythrin-like domain-containing protein